VTGLGRAAPFRAFVAAVFVTGAIACAKPVDAGREEAVTVRDSADITIVEHTAAQVAALPVWTIDTAPLLRLRTPDEDGFTALGDILALPDGRILLADRVQRDVREFTADGSFARVFARNGSGPGEITFVTRLQRLPGDTLAILDGNARLLSYFDATGTYLDRRSFPRFDDGAQLRVTARLHDGRWLGTTRPRYVPPTQFDGPARRDTFAIVGLTVPVSGDGPTRVDTIALVPDSEVFDFLTTQGGETYPDQDAVRLGARTNVATDGARLVLGTNEHFELREYKGDQLRRLIRLAVAPEPTPSDAGARVIAWSERMTAGRPAEARAELDAMRKKWRFSTTLPFHERLQLGDDGTLWASATVVLPTDPRRYLVFDDTGRAIARVDLPPAVEPFRVSRERIVGTWTDADDVPHVMIWRVQPAP